MILIEQLTEAQRKDLFGRVMEPGRHGCDVRRREFQNRFDIATDSYDTQIEERIKKTHVDKEVISEMCRYSVGYYNLWKRCARKIAVAYKRKPRRRLEQDVSGSTKLSDLYRNIGFDANALEWQRLSIVMNRIIVIVAMRKDEDDEDQIDFEVLTGANTEIWIDPSRKLSSTPDIAATKLKAPAMPGHEDAVIRTVDARAFHWWNADGVKLREQEHNMGTFPGADMSSTHGLPGEWWDWRTWRAATAASIDIGMIAASMGWTRKTQCRKIISLLSQAPDDETPDGQNLADHETPKILRGLQMLVSDLNTGVEGFIAHIKSISDEIAEQMTGTASTFVDPDPSLATAGMGGAAQHEAIKEVRESQIAKLDRFEARMAFLIATLERQLHPEDALDPAEVKEKFRVTWSELAFLDTPEARIRVWSEETKFGISDQVEAMMEKEGISAEEAEDRLMEIAKRRAKLDAFRASRNQQGDPMAEPTTLPLDAAPGESLAQTQGRAGGSVDADGNPTAPEGAQDMPAAAPDGKALPTTAKTGDVQGTALNGAQVTSLLDMGELVATGKLPLEFVARLLPVAFPGAVANEEAARRILEPLASFKAEPDPAPVGGAPFPPKGPAAEPEEPAEDDAA